MNLFHLFSQQNNSIYNRLRITTNLSFMKMKSHVKWVVVILFSVLPNTWSITPSINSANKWVFLKAFYK
jgi:hypothetical protein